MRRTRALAAFLLAACGAAPLGACPLHDDSALPPTLLTTGTGDLPGDSPLLSRTRQYIIDGARSGEGYFSPDGSLMTFQSEREPGNPFFQIYLLNRTSGETERVSTGAGKTTCSYIHPTDPNIVQFASTHADPRSAELQRAELDFRASGKTRRYSWDYDPAFDLWTRDRRTGALTQLTTEHGYDAEGAYSPDGRLIVFSSNRTAFGRTLPESERAILEVNPSAFCDIYVMNADGTDVRRLTTELGYDGGPFFSPDGRRIIWRKFDEKGLIADIWTMAVDGSDKRQVTDFGCMSWAPFYHPSMKYIFFASNKMGFENFEVYIVDAEGTREPIRVTGTAGFDGLPVPTPDGDSLTWVTNRKGGGSQIFIARWNHEGALEALRSAPPRTAAAPAAAKGPGT